VKRLMWFAQEVLNDLGTWCDTSTIRDQQTVAERYEHEGVEFLTLTLPEYGKAFELALSDAQFGPSLSKTFHYSGHLPRFLQGFVDQVFDRETGALLQDPSIVAIWAIRQFTLMFAKIVPPPDREKDRAAMALYLECEQDVRETDRGDSHAIDGGQFARIGSLLWARIFTEVERRIFAIPSEIIPKHGPGATADKLRGNAKWRQLEWPERLESVFSAYEHLASSWSSLPELADVTFLEPGDERPVKVVCVPKTYKTPRIIAIEPTCMQYMQQGLLGAFVDAVQADDIARQLIGWESSEMNNLLALKGSSDGSLATLDLSEASDRVSFRHVIKLMDRHPGLLSGVSACRSTKAEVLGTGIISLSKFASMGSALTFPLESMVFLTVVLQGIENASKAQLTANRIKRLVGRVRIYGDDIIVPVEYVSAVVESLEAHGLKVNSHKSFWTGKFRESCGKEYYDGTDVSIVRVRRAIPHDRQHGEEILSWISLRNQLYFAGLWKAASWVDELLHGLKIPMPVVLPTSPIQGRHSFLGYETAGRTSIDTQSPLVRGVVVKTSKPISELNGGAALLKVLTSKHFPPKEVEHETSSGGIVARVRLPRGQLGRVDLVEQRDVGHPLLGWPHCSVHVGARDENFRQELQEGQEPDQGTPVAVEEQRLCDQSECDARKGSPIPQELHSDQSRASFLNRSWSTDQAVSPLDTVILDMLHGRSPTVDVNHLHRAGRPRRVSIRLRWGTPW